MNRLRSSLKMGSGKLRPARKVTDVKRHRGQDAVVHFLDLSTQRTGNVPLRQFSNSASAVARIQF